MQLHAFPLSGNSRKVLMTLHELGLPCELIRVDLMRGEQHQEAFRRLNPNGRVPVLVDGDLVLWESSAIMLYLAEIRPEGGLLPAAAAPRAAMYRWLVWQPGTFNPPLQQLSLQIRQGNAADAKDPALGGLRQTIADNIAILAKGLGKANWLCGDFSLADIVMAPHLHALVGLNLPLPENLEHYLERLRERPSWSATLAWSD